MANPDECPLSEEQVRLMLWCIPRSLSTVLSKCLSFVDGSKVFFENYVCAYLHDPDRGPNEYENSVLEKEVLAVGKEISEVAETSTGFDVSQFTYQWVKEQLEKAHVGKRFIFCKDMAYAMTERMEFLPKGYRHLFLIRHPLKVFPSWKRLFQAVTKLSPDEFNLTDFPERIVPKGLAFQEIHGLFEHVKREVDQEPIIIDADDLLRDPKGIMSSLFKLIGLPFDEKLLSWEAGGAVTEHWAIPRQFLQGNQLGGYYQTALDSTCFLKPRPLPDRSSVSPDLLPLIDAAMPHYENMYAQRLVP